MATRITKDHHLLTRNLKLNDNYISNDGGDEGLSVDNEGIVTATALVVDKDLDNTTAATTIKALHVDLDRTGDVSSGIDIATGIDVDVDHTGASGGTISSVGINIDINGDTGGGSTGYGLSIDIGGGGGGGDDTDTSYGIFCQSSAGTSSNGIYIDNKDGGTDFKNVSSAASGDYFTLNTIADGETTLTTVENGVGSTAHLNMVADGDFTVDAVGDITLDAAGGDVTVLQADVTIPIDKKVIFGNAGEYIVGDDTDLSIVSSNTITMDFATQLSFSDGGVFAAISKGASSLLSISSPSGGTKIDAGGDITLDANSGVFNFKLAGDADDLCTLTVAANGVTTLATADSDGAVGHLNIEADGHVEFDGCAAGFDKETTTFAASAVLSEGDDSTDIDFRLGNKHELTLTDDIAGSGEYINMFFPATSGNFILVLIQGVADCTVNSTGWRAYNSDEDLCDNDAGQALPDGRVRWGDAGPPTLSTAQYDIDIISIYWDADHETAFAIASKGF